MLIHVNNINLNIELLGCELTAEGKLKTDKPVLIAIPGGPGFSHTFLKPGLNPIAENFPLIYVDPRGTGKSDLSDPEHWTLKQHAEDIIALLQHLDIKKPVLYGHSGGACYAAAIAQLAPDYIKALILANSPLQNKQHIFNNFIRLGGDIAKRLIIDLDIEGFAEYAEKVLPLYDPVERPLEHAQTLEVNSQQCLHMFHECLDLPILDIVKKTNIPTHFLLSKLDPLYPSDEEIPFIEKFKHDQFSWTVFEKSGHDILLTEREKMLEVIDGIMGT